MFDPLWWNPARTAPRLLSDTPVLLTLSGRTSHPRVCPRTTSVAQITLYLSLLSLLFCTVTEMTTTNPYFSDWWDFQVNIPFETVLYPVSITFMFLIYIYIF